MTSEKLKQLYPNASPAFIRLNATDAGKARVQIDGAGKAPFLERDTWDAALQAPLAKKAPFDRVLIVVTSYRRRLLDQDNLCCKYIIDLCRYAGIISGDSPGAAEIKVAQEKLGPKEPERVTIEIYTV